MVYRNLCQDYLLEMGPTQILGDHATIFIVHHVVIHADFSSMIFFGSLDPHLLVRSELGQTRPFETDERS